MAIQRKSLQDRAEEMSNGLAIMTDRDKADLDRLIGEVITIKRFEFMNDTDSKTGEPSKYVVFTIEEDDANFYFGGKVLTEKLLDLQSDGYEEEINEDGLPTLLGKKKGKNKMIYTTVEFYPVFTPEEEKTPATTKPKPPAIAKKESQKKEDLKTDIPQ